ncbi:MAG: hypothetical protein ABF497_05515 [Sporolactobacillus sp.]
MLLKQIYKDESPHAGWGAGSGYVIREEYECPCGKGKVVYERDDIPGFRDTDITCDCGDCNDKYDFSRGTATLKKQ